MPTICRFYGIIVYMNYNDHDPPHFHARYQDQEVIVEIETGIVRGEMSRRTLRMLFEWSDEHQEDLSRNWNLAREHRPLEQIMPLDWRRPSMFLHVVRIRHTRDYKLEVTFDNGDVREADLKDELYGEIFEPLKDLNFFTQATVNEETRTVEWPNGADLAPEFLHKIGKETKQAV